MDAGHWKSCIISSGQQGQLLWIKKKFDYKRICAVRVNLVTALKKCVEKWPYFPTDPLIHGLLQILSFNEYKMICVLSIILLI